MPDHKSLQKAIIREDECIGCAKCLVACPVDAIIGAAKFMHTVMSDECIGCRLCVEPCPVDCIEMYDMPLPTKEARRSIAQQARKRVAARRQRLNQVKPSLDKHTAPITKVAEIAAVIARVTEKKRLIKEQVLHER